MNEKQEDLQGIFTLVDEEGNQHEFELIGTCEKNGTTYYAMVALEDEAKNEEFYEYIILKSVIVDGEEDLITIDDDDEFDDVADYFDDLFSSEVDYDQQ